MSIVKVNKPNRISYTYEQIINGTTKDIMPLYCPVRELEWCENWDPTTIFSNTGLVEKDCIFITPDENNNDVVWIVSDYNIEQGHVVMYYHIPGVLITKLEIQLTPTKVDKTKAILTYSKTSLSKLGDKELKKFTNKEYNIMMESWEKAMNHFLATGDMLTGLPNF